MWLRLPLRKACQPLFSLWGSIVILVIQILLITGESQHVISALKYLGINTIHDQSPAYVKDRIAALGDNTVAAAGIRFDALVPGSGPVNMVRTF